MGFAVVRTLRSQGHVCRVLDGRPLAIEDTDVTHIYGRSYDSIVRERALEGVEAVIHLEWSGGVHEANADPLRTHERNVGGALALLEACRTRKIPILFASSGVYPGTDAAPYTEDVPLARHSFYGVQKSHVEGLLSAYSHAFGIPALSLRFGNVYGPGARESQIIPRLRRAIRANEPVTLTGDGGQRRDFIHVQDVADAIVVALSKVGEFQGDPINVGTGVGTSLKELTEQLGQISGHTPEIRYAPARGEESRYLTLDPQRAAERLGWTSRIPLAEGLREVVG